MTRRLPLLIIVFASTLAHATQTYPALVWKEWTPEFPPGCQVCHTSPLGGADTATQPFVIALKNAGAVGENEDSLKTALATLKDQMNDADNDGCSDYVEVNKGADPNVEGCEPVVVDMLAPRYGCGASAAPSVFTALPMVVVLAAVRRRFRLR